MLHIHRAERADRLADALAAILAEPPQDPFTPEVIAVPTRGMERWLTQRISARLGATPGRRDGVCANVEFPFPGRLIGGAIATASGIDPADDPWPPERSVWPLLDVVERCLGEPWLVRLATHLGWAGASSGSGRRFGRLRLIAELYDEYGIRRPAMLQAWARGEDSNGSGDPLPPGAVWQAELWRRLRAAIAVPSPAERLDGACAGLREAPEIIELPARLSLFGVTRLPASHVEGLSAIAAGRDVHLFVLHPSPALWRAVSGAIAGDGPIVIRSQDKSADLPDNRLLASWGADSRELQLVLEASGEHADHHHGLDEDGDETVLRRIQTDVRANRPPPGVPLPGEPDDRLLLRGDDRSVEIHSCHGPARQVEVLREAILHLLQDDDSLEPRDIIVMCPDIETFAPLIQATFGSIEASDGDEAPAAEVRRTDLRVRLADRSLRQTNPVLGVVAQLVDLAEQRLTASQVLDLADSEPVRRRFRFDDDDLARIQDWVAKSGIRWGLDAAHRVEYQLDSVTAGTWQAGLRRILLGVAMSESGWQLYEGVLPVDDVESGAIDLVGRFTEFLDRVGASIDALRGPNTVAGWAGAIADAADALTATSDRDAWQRRELRRMLTEIVTEANGSATTTRIALSEVRALLGHRLQGRPTRANFRTGHLTVCTLVPMRSVPHRVVYLLGLDDGAFPRKSPRDGDDLLLDAPHVGDRDPRTEDRQMLLDALLAARERLIIMFSGNDERTNAPRPPAVPVGELLDAVDRTARTDEGRARDRVVARHPLQPFDPRNFLAGELVPGIPWSFDQTALDGATALSEQRGETPPFLAAPLPPLAASRLALDDLVQFVERPVRAFLRQRLGISVTASEDEIDDALPVELDHLEVWNIGQRLLEGTLAGLDPDSCVRAEIARGSLPPGRLRIPVLERIGPAIEAIAACARFYGGTEAPRSVEINLALSGERRLTGSVSGVRRHVLLTVSYARLSPRHRLAAWVRLLALSAAHPNTPFEAVTVGKARYGTDADVTIARIGPLGPDADLRKKRAFTQLEALVDLRDRGMREALPIPSLPAAAYAQAAAAGADPEAAANKAWTSGFNFDGEDVDPDHQRAFGGIGSLADLLREHPRPDEQGEDWDAAEPSRFGRYARRLWHDLLAAETVSDL
ncbi:MAG: exodeoxyribonuclease V subunit gamma [Actinomycetota bacterium]|nr:exodeoxyribonuclease V subunit gamma [Actinomycetota bacterium]